MTVLTWDEQYSVKVKELDDQHKKLFFLINQLDEHIRQGQGTEILGNVLLELVDYTKVHFADEERHMREIGYSGYEEHKAIHDKLTEKVNAFYTEYRRWNSAQISLDLLKYLHNWITKHIMGRDQKFASA